MSLTSLKCFGGFPFHFGESPDSAYRAHKARSSSWIPLWPPVSSALHLLPSSTLPSWELLEHGQTLSTSEHLYSLFSILFPTQWRKAGSLTASGLSLSQISFLALSLVCSPSLSSVKTLWSLPPQSNIALSPCVSFPLRLLPLGRACLSPFYTLYSQHLRLFGAHRVALKKKKSVAWVNKWLNKWKWSSLSHFLSFSSFFLNILGWHIWRVFSCENPFLPMI